jgi:hypothetical protein
MAGEDFRAKASDLSRMTLGYSYVSKVESATDATYDYFGFAAPGTATSAAKWRIIRVHKTQTQVHHADGNADFDNVWDDYAGLSYS